MEVIKKARKYDSNLEDVKAVSSEDVKRFWDILTGQYTPALVPTALVGIGAGVGYNNSIDDRINN